MSRTCRERIVVSGTLECITPLHVGGLGGDADVDMSLAVNGCGNYYVPGTSLAGAMRAWVLRRAGSSVAKLLFGFQSAGRDAEGHASYLSVYDAELTGVRPEVRDGVGIDRNTGASAEHILYTRAILPKGSSIPFGAALRIPEDDDGTAEAVFADLIDALARGWVSLGAGTSRGLGRVILRDTQARREELSSRKGMLAALKSGGDSIGVDELKGNGWSPHPQPMVSFTVEMESDGPMMTRSGATALAVDDLPLTTSVDGRELLVLAGSSVKGALRSTAERIVRTVTSSDGDAEFAGKAFADQLEVPLVREVFGSLGDSAIDDEVYERPDEGRAELGLGAISVPDTHAQVSVAAEDWREMVGAKDAVSLRERAVAAGASHVNAAFHVSIDRWTGGVAGGRLFSSVEPLDIAWDPMRIDLDLTRLGWESPDEPGVALEGIALATLALHELSAGRVPLGFATNRGMGGVLVKGITISGRDLAGAGLQDIDGKSYDGGFREVPTEFRQLVGDSWSRWCTRQSQKGDGNE